MSRVTDGPARTSHVRSALRRAPQADSRIFSAPDISLDSAQKVLLGKWQIGRELRRAIQGQAIEGSDSGSAYIRQIKFEIEVMP